MKIAKLTLIACAATILSGCATLEEASTSLSCMLSRVTSAADPNCGSSATASVFLACKPR